MGPNAGEGGGESEGELFSSPNTRARAPARPPLLARSLVRARFLSLSLSPSLRSLALSARYTTTTFPKHSLRPGRQHDAAPLAPNTFPEPSVRETGARGLVLAPRAAGNPTTTSCRRASECSCAMRASRRPAAGARSGLRAWLTLPAGAGQRARGRRCGREVGEADPSRAPERSARGASLEPCSRPLGRLTKGDQRQ